MLKVMPNAFSGRRASQLEFELTSFINLLVSRGVKSYLEIGSREGDTFVEIMRALPHGSKGVAVDLPGGLWGKSTTRDKLVKACEHLNENGRQVSYLFGNSQESATRRIVVGRGPYDAILIDGDHTLEGVTRDFEAYGKMAPLIAFHDIVGLGCAEKVHGNQVEVPILWKSIKERYSQDDSVIIHEFIEKGSNMGIGVIEFKNRS